MSLASPPNMALPKSHSLTLVRRLLTRMLSGLISAQQNNKRFCYTLMLWN